MHIAVDKIDISIQFFEELNVANRIGSPRKSGLLQVRATHASAYEHVEAQQLARGFVGDSDQANVVSEQV